MHSNDEAILNLDWKNMDTKPNVLVFVNPIEKGFYEYYDNIIDFSNIHFKHCKFIVGDSLGEALFQAWGMNKKRAQEEIKTYTKFFSNSLHKIEKNRERVVSLSKLDSNLSYWLKHSKHEIEFAKNQYKNDVKLNWKFKELIEAYAKHVVAYHDSIDSNYYSSDECKIILYKSLEDIFLYLVGAITKWLIVFKDKLDYIAFLLPENDIKNLFLDFIEAYFKSLKTSKVHFANVELAKQRFTIISIPKIEVEFAKNNMLKMSIPTSDNLIARRTKRNEAIYSFVVALFAQLDADKVQTKAIENLSKFTVYYFYNMQEILKDFIFQYENFSDLYFQKIQQIKQYKILENYARFFAIFHTSLFALDNNYKNEIVNFYKQKDNLLNDNIEITQFEQFKDLCIKYNLDLFEIMRMKANHYSPAL